MACTIVNTPLFQVGVRNTPFLSFTTSISFLRQCSSCSMPSCHVDPSGGFDVLLPRLRWSAVSRSSGMSSKLSARSMLSTLVPTSVRRHRLHQRAKTFSHLHQSIGHGSTSREWRSVVQHLLRQHVYRCILVAYSIGVSSRRHFLVPIGCITVSCCETSLLSHIGNSMIQRTE